MREQKLKLMALIEQSTNDDDIEGYRAMIRDIETAPIKYGYTTTGVVMNIKEFIYKCLVIPKGIKGDCTIKKNGSCEVYIAEVNQTIHFASEYFLEKSFYWILEEKN